MHPSLAIYNLALTSAASVALPCLWVASRLGGRMGSYLERAGLAGSLAPAGSGPRVWLQAVSVGEVGVARALAEELLAVYPSLEIVVSSSTPMGLSRAREALRGQGRVVPFPLDLPWSVAASVNKIRPTVYASLETEIWPNLLAWLESKDVPILLLNGRLSPRSFPRYQKIGWLLAPALKRFTTLSMISPGDAERIIALGAPPKRVRVDGNAKFAGLVRRAAPGLLDSASRILAVGQEPLLVAGSVRCGEESPVLEAFQQVLERYPKAVLAAVPRHARRASRWQAACNARGLSFQAWTSLSVQKPRDPATKVVVVDVMGELFALYGLARAAYVGGSMAPCGGQNPMEPAAWGVPLCFGPSMQDFTDVADALLESGAARQVGGSQDLAREWLGVLSHPQKATIRSQAGKQVAMGSDRTAGAAAQLILEQLEKKGAMPPGATPDPSARGE